MAILKRAEELPNTRQLCKRAGISRPTFYRWRRRYQAEGEAGLLDHSRRPHSHRRQLGSEMVQLILELAHAMPDLGCKALAETLREAGHCVGPTSIQKTLVSVGLGKRKTRQAWSRDPLSSAQSCQELHAPTPTRGMSKAQQADALALARTLFIYGRPPAREWDSHWPTLKEVAAKTGIPERTLERHAGAEAWTRRRNEVTRRRLDKTVEAARIIWRREMAQANLIKARMALNAFQAVQVTLSDPKSRRPSRLLQLASLLAEAYKDLQDVLGPLVASKTHETTDSPWVNPKGEKKAPRSRWSQDPRFQKARQRFLFDSSKEAVLGRGGPLPSLRQVARDCGVAYTCSAC